MWMQVSIGKKEQQMKVGVLETCLGRFIMGGTSWDFGSFSIIEAEVMILKEAIQTTIHMQLDY